MEFWGITGRIGSGKTAMLSYLEELGFCILAADKVAFDVTQPQHPKFLDTKKQIENLVGLSSFSGDKMDRSFVREWMGNGGEAAKKSLTSILHPIIREDIELWMRDSSLISQKQFAFVEAIEMYDSGDRKSLSRILNGVIGVVASQERRTNRAMERDGQSEEAIQKISELQMSDEELEARANFIITNEGTLSQFRNQILQLLDRMKNSK